MQRFYDWYVPAAASSHSDQLALLATPEARADVAPELLRAWRADREAQSRDHDYIVGLDFDPVTNSQDPCERYQAVAAHPTGETYWIDVQGAGGCAPHSSPDIVVQVVCSTPASCAIVNFHYPDPPASDMRSVLQQLREERTHYRAVGSRSPRSPKE